MSLRMNLQGVGAGLSDRTGDGTSEQLPDGTGVLFTIQSKILAHVLVNHEVQTDLLLTVSAMKSSLTHAKFNLRKEQHRRQWERFLGREPAFRLQSCTS